MWSISEVKERGREAFKSNYWRTVLVALMLSILTAGSSMSGSANSMKNTDTSMIPSEEMAAFIALIASIAIVYTIVWSLLRLFVLNPLEVGCHAFLKNNIEGDVTLDELKTGFSNYMNTVLTILLRDVFLALWFCLLIIPGVIKSYSYMMVPYLLTDEPDLSPMEAIKKSCAMMKGNKWRAFVLDLSFIGWFILSMFTFGLVGLLYAEPYRRSARAAIYLELRDNA